MPYRHIVNDSRGRFDQWPVCLIAPSSCKRTFSSSWTVLSVTPLEHPDALQQLVRQERHAICDPHPPLSIDQVHRRGMADVAAHRLDVDAVRVPDRQQARSRPDQPVPGPAQSGLSHESPHAGWRVPCGIDADDHHGQRRVRPKRPLHGGQLTAGDRAFLPAARIEKRNGVDMTTEGAAGDNPAVLVSEGKRRCAMDAIRKDIGSLQSGRRLALTLPASGVERRRAEEHQHQRDKDQARSPPNDPIHRRTSRTPPADTRRSGSGRTTALPMRNCTTSKPRQT